MGEAGGDKAVPPGQVMRSAVGHTGGADRDRAHPLEPAVEQAARGPGNGSERQQDTGREAKALLHDRQRLDQRAAIPPPDETQQARAIGMAVHVGKTVEEAEQAFVHLRLDQPKGRAGAQVIASRSRAPRGRNLISASFRMSR